MRSDEVALGGGAKRGVLGCFYRDAPCFWRFHGSYWAKIGPAVLTYAVSQWRSSSVKGSVELRVA